MSEHRRDTRAITEGRAEKMAKHGLFETERFFCDVYVLQPGQTQKPHSHVRQDKCYVGLSGRGTALVGDARHVLEPGVVVWCPEGVDHGLEQEGPGDLRVLVFLAREVQAR